MSLRIIFALVGALACLSLNATRAAAYDLADYDWCFNNMSRFFDRQFEACTDAKCLRISNKNVSQKRACYSTCRGDAVDACLAERGKGAQTTAVARPASATESAPVAQPETPAGPAAAEPAAPSAPGTEGEGKREGFFSRLIGGVSDGISSGFDADYNWCRDKSGGHFQDLMDDCRSDCLARATSNANRRQGCLLACRSQSVEACIAKRDGK